MIEDAFAATRLNLDDLRNASIGFGGVDPDALRRGLAQYQDMFAQTLHVAQIRPSTLDVAAVRSALEQFRAFDAEAIRESLAGALSAFDPDRIREALQQVRFPDAEALAEAVRGLTWIDPDALAAAMRRAAETWSAEDVVRELEQASSDDWATDLELGDPVYRARRVLLTALIVVAYLAAAGALTAVQGAVPVIGNLLFLLEVTALLARPDEDALRD